MGIVDADNATLESRSVPCIMSRVTTLIDAARYDTRQVDNVTSARMNFHLGIDVAEWVAILSFVRWLTRVRASINNAKLTEGFDKRRSMPTERIRTDLCKHVVLQ